LGISALKENEEMNNQFEEKMAHLIIDRKEHWNGVALPDPKGVWCSFCGREIEERASIISGHAVSICSECRAFFNEARSGAIGVWRNLAI
jgi:hypothetical protein